MTKFYFNTPLLHLVLGGINFNELAKMAGRLLHLRAIVIL